MIALLGALTLLAAPLELGGPRPEAESVPSCGQRAAYTGLATLGGLAFAAGDVVLATRMENPLPLLLMIPQVVFVNAWLAPAFDFDVGAGTMLRAGLVATAAMVLAFMAGLPMATDGVGAIFGAGFGIVAFSTVFPLALANDDGWSTCCSVGNRRARAE